ncbi:hydroxymethylpyrimidine pyrophosphatase-like HAD family hydrolase [Paenibacillus sp. V4I3]|nr:hydroxymethylpyrimidine pyrophosphatase-like HAD family hydrolase [Paenibacillus sp. V4I3]
MDYLNINKSEAIAFGEGDNDIDMLEYVGLGIAMENGEERLKKKADIRSRINH